MKKLIGVLVALVFACAQAYANGESDHPGANPPGGGWGCHDNPGKSDCHKPDTPKPPTQPPGNPGGGNAADVNNVAKNWSSLNSSQRMEMWNMMTSEQKAELRATLSVGVDVTNKFGDMSTSSSASVTGGAVTIGGDRTFNWTPVQVASLPSVINSGGFKLEAVSSCGPRRTLRPFDRQLPTGTFFGGWNQWRAMETVHGVLTGYTEEPYKYLEYEEPSPFYKKTKEQIGHRLYMVVSVESLGGGSSSAYNSSGDSSGRGFGLSNSSAGHTASVGYVAIDCVRQSYEASTKPEPTPPPPPPPPISRASVSDILTVRVEETVRGRRGGLMAVLPPDFCKKNPGQCKPVTGSVGKRMFTERTIDCTKPASPEDAKLCAERKSQVGQPPVTKEETLK